MINYFHTGSRAMTHYGADLIYKITSPGARIAAAVNVQLSYKTRLRVMGSSPAGQGSFGNENFLKFREHRVYLCLSHDIRIQNRSFRKE